MNQFDTETFRRFTRHADSAGYACLLDRKRDKLLVELRAADDSAGKLELYHADESRFGQICPAYRDKIRELWHVSETVATIERRASEEFQHYLTIYEPCRHDNIEFTAITDCVIRLYESDGMEPPSRDALIGDLKAVECAYDSWTRR